MRAIMIAVAALVVLTAVDVGHAASEKRFCIIPGGTASGSGPNCSFDTLEQCRASRDGTQYCSENPYYRASARTKGRRSGHD
jgi:hypothetical protein